MKVQWQVMTELHQDVPISALATNDFKNWRPAEEKTRHAESVPYARFKRAIDDRMARPERANGTPRAGHFDQNDEVDGTPRAGTYSIPGRYADLAHVGEAAAAILDTARKNAANPTGKRVLRAGGVRG